MAFVLGLTVGVLAVVTVLLLRGKKQDAPPTAPPTREQRQLWHEYQNFLNYNGDEQAAFEE